MRSVRYPRTLATLAVLGALAVALVVAFDWNWVKGPLQNYLSGKLGRAFVINGDLKGELSLTPRLTGSDVTIANAPWGSEPLLGRAKEVAVRVDLRSLFGGGNVSLPELQLADAAFLFERDAEGRENWTFGDGSKKLDIGRLEVGAGTVRYFDRERGIDIRSRIESAKSGDDGQLTLRFDGSGVWETGELTMKGTATTPFAANVPDRPYRLNVEATTGATNGTFDGSVVLARGVQADGTLTINGKDLSELGRFVPIEFSRTPPYRITGRLKHANGAWSLENLSAKIGETDLAGRLDVDRTGKRTQVAADLTSQSAHYREMRALVGLSADDLRYARVAPDGKAKKAGTTPATADRAKGSPDLARVKLVDAKIKLKAKRFTVPRFRFDDLTATIELQNGVMKIQPLDFVLAGGQVSSTISVDARDKIAKATADMKVRDVDLNVLVPKLRSGGNAGKASGRGHFTATGNSVAELLASSDGEAALISARGNAGWISAGLGQIDLARAGKLLFRGDAATPINCAVADVTLKNGVMDIRKLVVDTETEAIVGDGRILLAEKRYDLEFTLHPKVPSLSALGGPVKVEGTFERPSIHRDGGPLLARVGAALGLTAVSPIVALLPLFDLGGEAGASCKTLVQNTRAKLKELKSIDPMANGSNADRAQARKRQ